MFLFDVYFQNVDIINYCREEKGNKLQYRYWYHTCYSVNIKQTKASAGLCRISLDAVCYHVTSPAMSRYDTVNLTTD